MINNQIVRWALLWLICCGCLVDGMAAETASQVKFPIDKIINRKKNVVPQIGMREVWSFSILDMVRTIMDHPRLNPLSEKILNLITAKFVRSYLSSSAIKFSWLGKKMCLFLWRSGRNGQMPGTVVFVSLHYNSALMSRHKELKFISSNLLRIEFGRITLNG